MDRETRVLPESLSYLIANILARARAAACLVSSGILMMCRLLSRDLTTLSNVIFFMLGQIIVEEARWKVFPGVSRLRR